MSISSNATNPPAAAAGQREFAFPLPNTPSAAICAAMGFSPWSCSAPTAENDNERLQANTTADGILRRLGVFRSRRRRIKAIGLFDGIGAHEAAAMIRSLPVDFLVHAEIAEVQSAILAARFPGAVNLKNVMAADFANRALAVSPDGFDLAVATPPCTAFSVAGDREGTESEQGLLAIRAVDLVNELGVPFALIENVPGLLSARHGADFGKFLGRLIGAAGDLVHPGGTWPNAGYAVGPLHHVTWRVLDAQYFGTPQRRRRVFILAAPDASAFSIFN